MKGKVSNAVTGEPLSEVDVRFVGSQNGTKTNEDGSFSIEKTGTTKTLMFSHQNFDQFKLNTEGITGDLNVTMSSNVRYNQYGQKVSRQVLSAESREGFLAFESEDTPPAAQG